VSVFSSIYCCYGAPERSSLNLLVENFLITFGAPMLLPQYTLLVTPILLAYPSRLLIFEANVHLKRTFSPDLVVEYDDLVWWGEFLAFFVEGNANCFDGCDLIFRPKQY